MKEPSVQVEERSWILPVVALVLAFLLLAVYYLGFREAPQEQVQEQHIIVTGYTGSEKIAFLRDPEIVEILASKGLRVDAHKRGSMEQVTSPESVDQDFLWPANSEQKIAIEKRSDLKGRPKSESIFSSPIVYYSWAEVVDALLGKGVTKEMYVDGDGKSHAIYYVSDLGRFVDAVLKGQTWSDMGVAFLGDRKRFEIRSTHPALSNSGTTNAVLVGLMYAAYDPLGVEAKVDDVVRFYSHLPFLEEYHSSQLLFDDFLSMGVGRHPLIVGYENQIIEAIVHMTNASDIEDIRQKVRILYPRPTVWNNHPFLALNEKGVRLMEALLDSRIQEIAWKRFGFRTATLRGEVDPADVAIDGVPRRVTGVGMPDYQVMQKLVSELSKLR